MLEAKEGVVIRLSRVIAARRLFAAVWIALALALRASQADAKDRFVTCVQNQLSHAGFDPGPTDGINGPKTRSALAAYREGLDPETETAFDALRPFSRRNAVGWCRQIGVSDRPLAQFWPSADPPTYHFSGSVAPVIPTLIRGAYIQSSAYLQRAHRQRFSDSTEILVVTTPQELADLVRDTTWGRPLTKAQATRWADRTCVHPDGTQSFRAFATFALIVFCGPRFEVVRPNEMTRMRQLINRVMVHELVHRVQNELAYNVMPFRPKRGAPRVLQPAWLIEGTALMIEEQFVKEKYGNTPAPVARLARLANLKDTSLAEIRQAERVDTPDEYLLSRFAGRLLTDRFGNATLFDYWTALGETRNADTAFRATFGMSVRDFEALATALMAAPALAKEYATDTDWDGNGLIADGLGAL